MVQCVPFLTGFKHPRPSSLPQGFKRIVKMCPNLCSVCAFRIRLHSTCVHRRPPERPKDGCLGTKRGREDCSLRTREPEALYGRVEPGERKGRGRGLCLCSQSRPTCVLATLGTGEHVCARVCVCVCVTDRLMFSEAALLLQLPPAGWSSKSLLMSPLFWLDLVKALLSI